MYNVKDICILCCFLWCYKWQTKINVSRTLFSERWCESRHGKGGHRGICGLCIHAVWSELSLTAYTFIKHYKIYLCIEIYQNIIGSNTDSSVSLDDSNSFSSTLGNSFHSSRKRIFRKFLRKFSYLSWKDMVCVLIRIASSKQFYWVHSTCHYCIEDQNDFPKLTQFASWFGVMIDPQRLELPMSRLYFHGPKDVRVIEVFLYLYMIVKT